MVICILIQSLIKVLCNTALVKLSKYYYYDWQLELKGELDTNKELAHDYRLLQQHYMSIKEQSVNLLEKRTGLEMSLKDHREVGLTN